MPATVQPAPQRGGRVAQTDRVGAPSTNNNVETNATGTKRPASLAATQLAKTSLPTNIKRAK